tara:strand:- start:1493 stop:1960 length:468 start_codon:yes stop_codon:yes gene_type:complete
MIKINVITNERNWFKYIKRPNFYLDKKIKKLNPSLKVFKKKHIFCTLLLSGSKEIKHLNKKFRKKNKVTDVLSFPFHSKKELKKKLRKDKEIYLGDIIINLNKVASKNDSKNFISQFDQLWIHGLVHLFGHDHKKYKDYKKMHQVENFFFNLVND